MKARKDDELCGAVWVIDPDQAPCSKPKDHAVDAPDTDWKRGYHSNGHLKWRADAGDIPSPAAVAVMVRWRTTMRIARAGMKALDEAQTSWLGDGPNAGFIMDLLRGVVLDACGCSCSPARRLGGPESLAGDVICPVHGVPADLAAPAVEVVRVWRVRDVESGGWTAHHSLEAAEASLARCEQACELETALHFQLEGLDITTHWDLIKVKHVT